MSKILFMMMKRTKFFICLSLIVLLNLSCSDDSNIFKSYDLSNSHWEEVPVITEGLSKIYFVDSKTGWAIGEEGKISITLTGGKTWYPVSSGTDNMLSSILFTDAKKGFVSGMNKTLLYTSNGGIVWNPINIKSDVSTMFSGICRDNEGSLWFITNYGEVCNKP
jgi:photosystem II stability/assembly factor-like uncharacterized protein